MTNRILIFLFVLTAGVACTLAQTTKTEKQEGPTGMKPQQEEPEVIQEVKIPARIREARLVHQVKPVYPPEAKAAGIEGEVVLDASIDKKGSIRKLCLLEGSPALVGSAVEAVWQWKYEPLLLDGSPVEISTRITVKYKLKDDTQKEPTK